MSSIINSYLKSPRVWAALAAAAVAVFGQNKLGLTADQITNIVLTIGSLVVGTSLRAPRVDTPNVAA